ncbi:MAG: MmgE/PrpD family protein [Candidatus Hodarchaeota archaeon]
MDTARIIARFICGFSFQELPNNVVDKCKRLILHEVGCAFGGAKTVAGKALIETANLVGGPPVSTVFGGPKSSCLNAAFTNSMLANILDYDDEIPLAGHPGATAISPALALAEMTNASGKDLITSVVAGYEVSVRACRALWPTSERAHKVLGLGSLQIFGTVASAGRILGLSEDQITNAIGIAGANAPVPSVCKTVEGKYGVTMSKNNYGIAVAAGTLAVILAKNGFIGPEDIFEGETGFWRMYNTDRYESNLMINGLGKLYHILDVCYKAYPAIYFTHGAINAMMNIVRDNDVRPDEVTEVIVKSHEAHTDLTAISTYRNCEPRNLYQAAFSVPYQMAVTLFRIKPGTDWFEERRLRDPKILELARKVKIIYQPTKEEEIPGMPDTSVEVMTSRGKFTNRVRFPHGSPQKPMPDSELEDKFKALSSGFVEFGAAEQFIKGMYHLEDVRDVTKLTELVSSTCAHIKRNIK